MDWQTYRFKKKIPHQRQLTPEAHSPHSSVVTTRGLASTESLARVEECLRAPASHTGHHRMHCPKTESPRKNMQMTHFLWSIRPSHWATCLTLEGPSGFQWAPGHHDPLVPRSRSTGQAACGKLVAVASGLPVLQRPYLDLEPPSPAQTPLHARGLSFLAEAVVL